MPDILKFLTDENLEALEKRLFLVFATIEYCRKLKQAESAANWLKNNIYFTEMKDMFC